MRYVLYFFTWVSVLGSLISLVQGELDGFLASLIITGPLLWWSKAVRDRRRRKLGLEAQVLSVSESSSKLKRSIQAARIEWNRVPVLPGEETRRPVDDLDSAQAEDAVTVERPAEVEPEIQTNQRSNEPEPEQLSVQREAAETDAIEISEPVFTAPETESSPTGLDAADEVTQDPVTLDAELDLGPQAKLWRDANGKNLHVGAQVNFLAKSKGQSVSIPGLLLGERDGKAVIEVQGGALLPANEYLIPWHVVSYRA